MTPEQEQDLRDLLGNNAQTTHFFAWVELALRQKEATRYLSQRASMHRHELKELYNAADKMSRLFSVLDYAERHDIPNIDDAESMFLYLSFIPALADQMLTSNTVKKVWASEGVGWATDSASAPRLRAWMEAVKDCAQNMLLDEDPNRRGRRKDYPHQVALLILIQGFCKTQAEPLPEAKDKFTKAATIVLAPLSEYERQQKKRLYTLRSRPRKTSRNPDLLDELRNLERAEKTMIRGRDWVRKLCDKALKDETWIDSCMKLATGNNSGK